MDIYTEDFEIAGIKYRVGVPESMEHYTLYKQDKWTGSYKKIPCWTDAEEKRFPKAAAWAGTLFLRGLRKGTKELQPNVK